MHFPLTSLATQQVIYSEALLAVFPALGLGGLGHTHSTRVWAGKRCYKNMGANSASFPVPSLTSSIAVTIVKYILMSLISVNEVHL